MSAVLETITPVVRGPAVGASVENPVVKTFSMNWFCVFSCLSYQLEYIHATRHQTDPGASVAKWYKISGFAVIRGGNAKPAPDAYNCV